MTARPAELERLNEPTQRAVAEFVRLLASGLSGRVTFECGQGGIRDWRVDMKGAELAQIKRHP